MKAARCLALLMFSSCFSCVRMKSERSLLGCSIKVASFHGGDALREAGNLTDNGKRQFLNDLKNAKIGDPPGGTSPSPKIKYVIEVVCKDFSKEIYCDVSGNPFFASGDKEAKSRVAEYCRTIIAGSKL